MAKKPVSDPNQPDEFADLEGMDNPTAEAASPDPSKEELTDLRAFKKEHEGCAEKEKNQDEKIDELTEANTELQEQLASAEKQHKVRQDSAVDVASKMAVRQVTKERDILRTKSNSDRRNIRILIVAIAATALIAIGIGLHDVFESTSLSPAVETSTDTKQPTPRKLEAYRLSEFDYGQPTSKSNEDNKGNEQ